MISSDGCRQLVAGNYDVIINEPYVIKSVLTDYLQRLEQYENILGQLECQYTRDFKLLKELSRKLKENKANLQDGEMCYNKRKNRYKDILPFSHTRVILSGNSIEDPSSSYINANYITGPSGSPKAYIACQGPLLDTLGDFWRMVWECNVSVIVMACNENESGRSKCEIYWPEQVETSCTYGNIQVTLMRERHINSDFLVRKFSVKLLEPNVFTQNSQQSQQTTSHELENGQNYYTVNNNIYVDTDQDVNRNPLLASDGSTGNSNTSSESINTDDATLHIQHHIQNHELNQQTVTDIVQTSCHDRVVLMERTICQFHYTTWPDHGVPDSVQPILELVRLIREVQPAEDKPILVHCSAGCGRTGTICCIDYVWGLLRRGKLDLNFDLYSIIRDMRQQRMSMVQTLEQYILCHRAVAALFTRHLQLIDGVYGKLDSSTTEDDNDDAGDDPIDNGQNCSTSDEEQDLGPVFI